MSPYSYYSLKSLSCLVTTQSDSYFKCLLAGASSLYDAFGYNDAFL